MTPNEKLILVRNYIQHTGIEIFLIKNVNKKVFEEYQDKFYD